MNHNFHTTILHIGRHKSGTTSLQHFLFNNQEWLSKMGLYYPKTGLRPYAHHDLALCFRPEDRNYSKAKSQQLLKHFVNEIRKNSKISIISSEAFQHVNPALLLDTFIPNKTKIIVYIREQIDYIISAYSQCVHANQMTETIYEYEKKVNYDYDEFLKPWEKAYGIENIILKVFERDKLFKQELICDFFNILGYEDVPTKLFEMNPTLGGSLLKFKLLINKLDIYEGNFNKHIWRIMNDLASKHSKYRTKPKVTPEFVDYISDKYDESNRKVFQRYFNTEKILFNKYLKKSNSGLDFKCSGSEFLEILNDVEKIDKALVIKIVASIIKDYQ